MEDFPRAHNTGSTPRSQRVDERKNSKVSRRISRTASCSCRCTATSTGPEKATSKYERTNSSRVADYARHFSKGHSFVIPRTRNEEKWYATFAHRPKGAWNRVAEQRMVSFAAQRVGHPVFRGTRPLSRGSLKSKDGGNTTKHNNAEPQTAELLLRPFLPSISSVISRAVADWCQDFTQRPEGHPSRSTERPVGKRVYL